MSVSFEDRKKEQKSSADKIVSRLLIMFLAIMLVNAAVTLSIVLYFRSQYDATTADQRYQGQQITHSICLTLDRLSALNPPAGSPSANPSRAYEQLLHATLAQLGPDLKCNG